MNVSWFDYSQTTTPDWYRCAKCEATGVRLWRGYMPFHGAAITCAACTAKDMDADITLLTSESDPVHKDAYDDKIRHHVPAIPRDDETWCAYDNTAEEAYNWWRRLPLRL